MRGVNKKLLVSAISALFLLGALGLGVVLVRQRQELRKKAAVTGSIKVCKVIIDKNGVVISGENIPGVTFTISGIVPDRTSEDLPSGNFGTANFTTPLIFTDDVLNNDGNLDAACIAFDGLQVNNGSYYYGRESVSGGNWVSTKYNDQYSMVVRSISEFLDYDANLFDGNADNDGSRNQNSDGHIILVADRPNRVLLVLNQWDGVFTGPRGEVIDVGPTVSPSPTELAFVPTENPSPSPTDSPSLSPTPAKSSMHNPTATATTTAVGAGGARTTTSPTPTPTASGASAAVEPLPEAGVSMPTLGLMVISVTFFLFAFVLFAL